MGCPEVPKSSVHVGLRVEHAEAQWTKVASPDQAPSHSCVMCVHALLSTHTMGCQLQGEGIFMGPRPYTPLPVPTLLSMPSTPLQRQMPVPCHIHPCHGRHPCQNLGQGLHPCRRRHRATWVPQGLCGACLSVYILDMAMAIAIAFILATACANINNPLATKWHDGIWWRLGC